MTKELVDLSKNDIYQTLLEDIRDVIIEKGTEARVAVIETKWLIGKDIVDSLVKLKRFEYGKSIVEQLANDLKISASGLYKCLQFYKRVPTATFDEALSKLPEGKNLSWHKITQKYLPDIKTNKNKDWHYIACKINDNDKAIVIKEKYQDYKIEYN